MIHTTKVLPTNKAAVAAMLLALGGTTQAATWQFSDCNGVIASGQTWASAGSTTSTWNNTAISNCGKASDGVAVDLRGYSTATPNSGTRVEAWKDGGIGYYTTGAESGDGSHAVDNKDGIDALILKFSQSVALSSVQIGWNGTNNGNATYNDSDISVYRWAGTSAPTATNGTGLTFSSSAWALVDHFADVGDKADNKVTFSTGNSSYWLVSAYNGTVWSKANDAFKLLSVAGTPFSPPPTGVPEPGSLALLGLGALGLLAARRKSLSVR